MLGKWALTSMMFLSVSGGPIGMESAMLGSNIYAVMFVCLWLLVTYMIPISFMSYEMCQLYDVERPNGGPVGWVYMALGRRWGIANAVWDILDTLIDNAIYPVLFADNFLDMGYISPGYHAYVAWGMIAATFLINYGEVEGVVAILLCLFIISPFIGLMCVTPWKDMYTQTNNVITWDSIQQTFTVLTWSINGYDMATPYAHKVESPKSSYQFAYIFNSVGTFLMMVVVFSLGSHYIHDPNKWVDGSFVTIADMAGGMVWRYWMGLATCAAAFGVLTAELCSTSFLFVGLSKMGFSNKFESPVFNLVLNVVILCACVMVDLDTLIELSAYLNTLTLQCEIFAYIMSLPQITPMRAVFIIWLTLNNIMILACGRTTCIVALLGAIGLALGCIWLSEKTIKTEIQST